MEPTWSQLDLNFDGETYDAERDRERLGAQLRRVFDAMTDGKWRSLYEISQATHDPVQSISARLRDLRKERFGAHEVERRNVEGGLFEYRLILNQQKRYGATESERST